jgi:hypothetical protein
MAVMLERIHDNVRVLGFEGGLYSIGFADSVLITAPNITLTDAVVSGDLTITQAVGDGTVTLGGTAIFGSLNVEGGGLNSVIIRNSFVAKANITKDRVRVVFEEGTNANSVIKTGKGSLVFVGGSATIKTMHTAEAAGGSSVTVGNGGIIENAVLEAPNSLVLLNGGSFVGNKTVSAADKTIIMDSGSAIKSLKITENAQGTAISMSGGSVIETANIAANAKITGSGNIDKKTVSEGIAVIKDNTVIIGGNQPQGIPPASPNTPTAESGQNAGGGSAQPSEDDGGNSEPPDSNGGGQTPITLINTFNLTSLVTAPARGAAPDTTEIDTSQYTGAVVWRNSATGAAAGAAFAPITIYKAEVTLAAKAGYTLQGVGANSFAHSGATATTNAADSGVITIVFPTTAAAAVTSALIEVTAPVINANPNATAAILNSENFSAGAVTWSPAVTSHFLGGIQYTATVLLTAADGYTFAGLAAGPNVTINGFNAAITNNTGTEAALSYEFAATAAPAVTGLSVTSQPTKLTYTEGESLNPSGLAVTLSYNDGTTQNIPFAEFAAHKPAITTNPPNGTTLTAATHHGNPIAVTAGTQSANTNSLTVKPAQPTFSTGFATPFVGVINGLTATGAISPTIPQAENALITVTITLTGTATAAGIHTVGLTSVAPGSSVITEPNPLTLTAAQGQAGVNADFIFTFNMPAKNVNDLIVVHTFEEITVNNITEAGVLNLEPFQPKEGEFPNVDTDLLIVPDAAYTIASIEWFGGGAPFTGKFEFGGVYRARIVLTAQGSSSFTEDVISPDNITIDMGEIATFPPPSLNHNSIGNSLTFYVIFNEIE